MSLNVTTVCVGEQEFTLRLTSKAIMNYCQKHGNEGNSPVIAVLEAVNDISAKIDLFTNALNHPENKNTLKDGAALLDLMADDDSWKDPQVKNDLILTLAQQSGLLSDEDYLSLIDPVAENGKKLISTMAKLLKGEPVNGSAAEGQTETQENPT